jgi:hypothetical protein
MGRKVEMTFRGGTLYNAPKYIVARIYLAARWKSFIMLKARGEVD